MTAARLAATAVAVAALAAAGSADASTSASSLKALAARYLAIATAGNRHLEDDLDPLSDRDRNDLARSRADLRDATATERLFDRRLLEIPFPPAIERTARELYRVNQLRATLTSAAALSASLGALHSYEPVLDAANAPVERSVRTIRRQLGLPPPDTS